jgi:hypothetical protein
MKNLATPVRTSFAKVRSTDVRVSAVEGRRNSATDASSSAERRIYSADKRENRRDSSDPHRSLSAKDRWDNRRGSSDSNWNQFYEGQFFGRKLAG